MQYVYKKNAEFDADFRITLKKLQKRMRCARVINK
jgi:hypothetical protein